MKAKHSFAILLIVATFLLGIGIANINNSYSQQQKAEDETKQQVIIKDKIKNFDWYGLEYQSDYIDTFTPAKAFDNQLITPQVKNSGWSQLGNSGFTVTLEQPLDQQICSAEIIPLNPKNNPFKLTLGNQSVVEGKLDSTSIPVSFNPCAPHVDLIKFDVKSANDKRNPIQEIKLFTSKKIPPIDPPVCPPNSYWDDVLKKCVSVNPPISNETTIVNSTLALKVSNSTIIITLDDTSKIVGPEQPQDKEEQQQKQTTPIGTPLNDNEEEEDKKDDNKNKDKKGDNKN